MVICLGVGGAAAQAPATREAAITQEAQAKAAKLVPEGPNRAERLLGRFEPFVLGKEPSGFYPWFGSVMGGGLLAIGPGYRKNFADTGHFDVFAAWSLRNYRTLDATLNLPAFWEGRGRVSLHGKYLFADKVSFYGLGRDSDADEKTSYTYEPTTANALLTVEAAPHLFLSGGFGYEHVDTSGGKRAPSVELLFGPVTAPGLGADVTYLVSRAGAAIDWRDSPGYSTRGGLYRIEVRRYDARDDEPYGFDLGEVELQQFVPLLRENWVLAFSALATVTSGRDGDEVPFFMMPTLGSGGDLRGFPNRRFRDRNRLLLQGEYRWRPSKFVDLALFYDAGKVERDRSDLDFEGLKTSWGTGIRFHGPTYTALRIEAARSREGWRLIFTGGSNF